MMMMMMMEMMMMITVEVIVVTEVTGGERATEKQGERKSYVIVHCLVGFVEEFVCF